MHPPALKKHSNEWIAEVARHAANRGPSETSRLFETSPERVLECCQVEGVEAAPDPPKPVTVSERQRDVLAFIADKIRGRGYGPTVREIGGAFDIKSPNGVMCHLHALETKGLIVRTPDEARAITLTDAGWALAGRGWDARTRLHAAIDRLPESELAVVEAFVAARAKAAGDDGRAA